MMLKIHTLILLAALPTSAMANPITGPYFGYTLGQVMPAQALLDQGAREMLDSVYVFNTLGGMMSLTLNKDHQVTGIESFAIYPDLHTCMDMLRQAAEDFHKKSGLSAAWGDDQWTASAGDREASGQCTVHNQGGYAYDVSFIWNQENNPS